MSQATVAIEKGKTLKKKATSRSRVNPLTVPYLPGGLSTSTDEEAAPPGPRGGYWCLGALGFMSRCPVEPFSLKKELHEDLDNRVSGD